MKSTFFWFFSLFISSSAWPQNALLSVNNFPTKEIYDLHVDRLGYLWLAHGLGISRYDGLNFTHYNSPATASLRMTDILEDQKGRIWYHNFSGQIFYIEKGKVNCLEAYNYKAENQYPRMVLCGDELIVTSRKGLFVCSVLTLKSRFIPLEEAAGTGLVSLTVLNDQVIVYNNIHWYIYTQSSGVEKLSADPALPIVADNLSSLQPASFMDTIYLVSNPAGILQKLLLKGNQLVQVAEVKYNDYINSVTVDRKAWVHTRNTSLTTDNTTRVARQGLTDVVVGKEGNIWYSSMKNGLMVSYKQAKWKKIKFPLENGDYVRTLNANGGYFFAGTQFGKLMVMKSDNGKPAWKYNLFNGYGSIDFIRYLDNDRFIVGASTNSYIVNAKEKRIENQLPLKAITDVDFDKNSLYFATPDGFYLMPYLNAGMSLEQWIQLKKGEYPFYNWNKVIQAAAYRISTYRSRAIRYDKQHETLFISTKDGLQQVTKKGIQTFTINGKPIFASSLWYKAPNLYIATINDGLWIKNSNTLKHFTTANFLFSNVLTRIKITGNHLWLFQDNSFQVFDIKTNKVIDNIDMPNLIGADVFDVAEKGNFAYLTTADGIYKVPMHINVKKNVPNGYLDYVIVNNTDTLLNQNEALKYNENDMQFFISSPSFYNPEGIFFKFRLVGADDEWQFTKPDERVIRFSSLMPGNYTFEAVAVTKDRLQQASLISFSFIILKPWWKQTWFLVLINIVLIGGTYYVVRYKMAQKLKVEKVRRGIATDLHDDLGATLSSINIYAELVQNEIGYNKHLNQIQKLVTDTVTRIDDLVWSINPKNDSMEQLIKRMEYTAFPLLKAASIQYDFKWNQKLLGLKLSLDDKRNLYLLFKELVNNVVKHAECTYCSMRLEYNKPHLTLSVTDDGKGFNVQQANKNRNGLKNMQYRASRMKGTFQVSSSLSKGSSALLQMKVN